MSISEAILFVASNSPACKQCVQFVSQHKMPMQIVRLDTESSRKTAANGKFFQITAVPTMVIMYEDGNTQLFLGTPKIVQWITALISHSRAPKEEAPRPSSIRHQENNMYGPISTAYPVSKSRRPMIDEGDDIEDMHIPQDLPVRPPVRSAPVVVEEDYPEDILEIEEPEEEKPKPRARTKKGKAKQQPVEDDPNAGKRRLAKEKLNRAAAAKSKPLSSKMKDVYNMAKQMEEDAKNSYGYKEEDLPHY